MQETVDILVDLDPYVYACGFASETTCYEVLADTAKGREVKFFAPTPAAGYTPAVTAGAKMKEWLASLDGEYEILSKERVVTPDPVDHCLHIVGQRINSTYNAVSELPHLADKKLVLRGFITGKGNYRDALATIVPYKGNRDKTHRPVHYKAIREYLMDKWEAMMVEGCEADDQISIEAEKVRNEMRDCVIVSIDKDLDQIAGQHYNPDKKVFYHQDPDSALLYFYAQALSGDATDNIPGCYKVGKVKAETIIQRVAYNYKQLDLNAQQELWNTVCVQYINSKRRIGCPYGDCDAFDVALETARLVYIQKASRELWNPPGIPFGVLPLAA